MDIEKLLKFGIDYLSDYLWVFVETLRSPIARFGPVFTDTGDKSTIIFRLGNGSTLGPQLNPKLISFVIINIFIGLAIRKQIPGGKDDQDFIIAVIVIFAIWFFYSSIIHRLCKLLQGHGTFTQTLSVSLQLLAVLYVVSNFVTFILGALVTAPQLGTFIATFGWITKLLVDYPSFIYFFAQFGLLIIYLPLAINFSFR